MGSEKWGNGGAWGRLAMKIPLWLGTAIFIRLTNTTKTDNQKEFWESKTVR